MVLLVNARDGTSGHCNDIDLASEL